MVEGTQVGAYRILERIGAGGMGEVWLAEHAILGRRAAVKVLLPEFSNRTEIVTRFFNEARAATAISDPGIVQIFDFGHHVDGSAYIVMELLDGQPLDKRLHQLGVLLPGDALRILRQVASSLGAAHARGIVHRDLKPENIFLVRDPEMPTGERAKLLDFGIAKLAGDHIGPKTQTSALMGTPTYMSPEQCRGAGQVDQRSDVYALGCVLFTLVTGRPPFDADGAGDIIAMHLREPPPLASSRRAGIPQQVDELIARCLVKDPSQRIGSGAALAAEIEAVLAATSLATGPNLRSTPVGGYVAAPTTLSSMAGQVAAPPRGRAKLAIAGAVIIAAIVGVGIWVSTRGAETPAPPTTTAPAAVPPPAGPPPPASSPVVASAPEPTSEQRTVKSVATVLTAFLKWSSSHVGAPCPTAQELSSILGTHGLDDGWGNAMVITCKDQPADQIIGVISAGTDGVIGTPDDLASWSLSRDVTAVIHGPRWQPAAVATSPAPTRAKTPARKPTTPETKPAKPSRDTDGDGIPDSR